MQAQDRPNDRKPKPGSRADVSDAVRTVEAVEDVRQVDVVDDLLGDAGEVDAIAGYTSDGLIAGT